MGFWRWNTNTARVSPIVVVVSIFFYYYFFFKKLFQSLYIEESCRDSTTRQEIYSFQATWNKFLDISKNMYFFFFFLNPCFRLNLNLNPGSLIAVVGTVGSGKSSLLSAMLGEMDKITGTVKAKVFLVIFTQYCHILVLYFHNVILIQ